MRSLGKHMENWARGGLCLFGAGIILLSVQIIRAQPIQLIGLCRQLPNGRPIVELEMPKAELAKLQSIRSPQRVQFIVSSNPLDVREAILEVAQPIRIEKNRALLVAELRLLDEKVGRLNGLEVVVKVQLD